ncbi:MAG: energy-coupling factor ABC transporter ATP-binding protein [Synergistaceae bacterium]|jgi:energy-coupling factor transport system ATP-binding protein|nr:energy-coupling factor ABC transporter ATP-binding protein [Synergistaceae bacterium]
MSIVVSELRHTYNEGTPARSEALRGVSVVIERGQWVSIVGHTGSGKSTLAQHLNLLLLPQSGSVSIDGTDVTRDAKNLRGLRRRVGLVFQYPEQQFFAETVRDEIEFAPLNWGVTGRELDECVEMAVRSSGLDPALLGSNPFAISGGQRRRAALASVLSMRPDYLVLDEPTAGLDAAGIRELRQLMASVRDEGMGVVQVTHDLEGALANSDRILVLERGVGVTCGDAESVAEYLLRSPVQGLLMPPLARFIAGLRERGIHLPLTAGVGDVINSLEERLGCEV